MLFQYHTVERHIHKLFMMAQNAWTILKINKSLFVLVISEENTYLFRVRRFLHLKAKLGNTKDTQLL